MKENSFGRPLDTTISDEKESLSFYEAIQSFVYVLKEHTTFVDTKAVVWYLRLYLDVCNSDNWILDAEQFQM